MRLFAPALAAIFLLSCLVFLGAGKSFANTQPFGEWLSGMRARAISSGVRPATVDAAFTGVTPLPRVLELDRKQPEGTMTFNTYRKRVVSQARITQGREMMRRHASELAVAEKRFGVPAQYIVALWGVETSYGANTGGFDLIAALATLAWDGRRSSFFSDELIKALQILDEGHISRAKMKGSWAGAMGQNQFMPSSFHHFAVDGDGDGHKDIWTNYRDVFASTANYLSTSGWHGDERWGREVKLPHSFPSSLVGLDVRKPISEWTRRGVKLPGGGALPAAAGIEGSIILPGGVGGPAYIVYNNYRVIMKWNKSAYFATSVGLLADAIAQ